MTKKERKAMYLAKVSSLIRSGNRDKILKEASDKFDKQNEKNIYTSL